MHETEFFIRKAIGWALRQYSYTAPQVVIQFVKKYRDGLSSLSVREALKALHRNGYISTDLAELKQNFSLYISSINGYGKKLSLKCLLILYCFHRLERQYKRFI